MLKNLACTILIWALLVLSATRALSAGVVSTSKTLAHTVNDRLMISQDAYLPTHTYLDLGLNKPQDLHVSDNKMYIADTGNKRILVVDLLTSEFFTVGEGILIEPVGVTTDEYGRIYAADSGNQEVYRFSPEGQLEFIFTRPEVPTFGETQGFKPSKVAAADEGGIYLVSEGNYAGIIHMNAMGDFLGYFASNRVSITLTQRMQDIFLTEEQKKTFLGRTPPSFSNIHKGYDGLIYSINRGNAVNVKKHSISGLDLFQYSPQRAVFKEPVDLCVAPDGRIFVLSMNGRITELTYDGFLISSWGGSSNKRDRIGLFEVPTGIGVDSSGNVYVLDSQRAYVQVFSPTQVQLNIHRGLQSYNEGLYEESKKLWEEVLKFNNNSFLAHLYIGRTYLQMTNYEAALEHFRIAGVKEYFSTAFWEIRNAWLQRNLALILFILIMLYISSIAFKMINKKYSCFNFIWNASEKLKQVSIINDLSQLRYSIKHPILNFENIIEGKTGSFSSATLIYSMLFIVLVLIQVGRGYIFSVSMEDFSIWRVITYYVVIIGLFIASNYYISAVNDGNGTLKAIYIGTAYSFAPVLIFIPFIIVISNFSTLNEAFLISASIGSILVWSIVNFVLMITIIHEYSFREALYNIFMTLFFMGVVVLAVSLAYLLLNQVWEFVYAVFTEVMLRARAS